MTDNAFELLAKPLQECLWRMNWSALRPIQEHAIKTILQTECDLIISARTASGKTEAAFLPILSRLVERSPASLGTVYISPLKALINDQFRRLEELCQHAEIPVHRWHGDVSAAAKQRLLSSPSGVLLITPESLESLFVNRSSSIARLFHDLQFAVIDELHAFVGRERGLHLRSLLCRVEQHVGRAVRLVALSATLGDWRADYARWLRPVNPGNVSLVTDDGDEQRVLFKIYGYTLGDATRESKGKRIEPEPRRLPAPEPEITNEESASQIMRDMLAACGGHKNLIFANSRQDVEWFADGLNEQCRRAGRREEFLVHHGSLSKELRESTEQAMRSPDPCTTVCSSSLELGIDIGDVQSVGQLGAPWSVQSLVQRLGRSGRRPGESAVMRLWILEDVLPHDASLIDRLHCDLLQAIALTELMLEKWIEPPELDTLDFSTLVQQILSVLAETGGASAADMFDRLVSSGAFRFVDSAVFASVLTSLGEHQIVEQIPGGELILSPEGEKIVRRYDFYSAFATEKEYAVLYSGQLIGTLPATDPPQPAQHLLLGGRRWRVTGLDVEKEEIFVEPARGKKAPRFYGAGGEIHPAVRAKMREILFSSAKIAYLNSRAADWLASAREAAVTAQLPACPWYRLGPRKCQLFTWTGTKIQRTVLLLASLANLAPKDDSVAITFDASVEDSRARLRDALALHPSPFDLAARQLSKVRRKYDLYLSEELTTKSFIHDALDQDSAVMRLVGWLDDPGQAFQSGQSRT